MENNVIIRMEKTVKRFPGVIALQDVDFTLLKGEIHALVGENGAGKSTLVKILDGVFPPTEGKISIDGKITRIESPLHAKKLGISMIHQELMLAEPLSAAENILLGNLPRRKVAGIVNWQEAKRRAKQLLEHLGVELDINRPVHHLSIAQRQMIEIARALTLNARVFILDEPSSFLSRQELRVLFSLIKSLQDKGCSVIYISHRLEEIFQIADRVTVLKDGKLMGTLPINEVSREKLIKLMTGRELREFYPSKEGRKRGEEVLRVQNLSWDHRLFEVNLKVHKGEIHGIYGLVGSGRTELAKVLFGRFLRKSGEVAINGEKIKVRHPKDAIRSGIAYVPEDRHREGVISELSVGENISIIRRNQDKKKLFPLVNKSQEKKQTAELITELAIRTPSGRQKVKFLSGGNQQKVVLAKWLNGINSQVIMFDEPTRGIDVGTKSQIYRIMDGLARKGKALILISSELPEILGLSDKILVMAKGKIVGEFTGDTSEEEILACALKGKEGV